ELSAGVVGVHLRGRAGADQRGTDGRLPEHPGQRDLAHAHTTRLRHLAPEALDHADVRLEVVGTEDRLAERHAVSAPVTGGIERRRRREGPGQQAVAERAIAYHAD